MLQLRQYALGAALAVAALLNTGCTSRPMSVPSSAQAMTEGNGDKISYRAGEFGRVYVADDSTKKILYQGDVRRDETVEVLPRDNRIMVGGRVVNEASMRDGDTYKIYFEPMDRARVVKHRVVEEEYHAPK
jgi:hypothetical protein